MEGRTLAWTGTGSGAANVSILAVNRKHRWYNLGMLLTPDLRVGAAYDVSPDLLAERGIEGLLIDMDDTILASDNDALAPRYRSWFDGLLDRGLRVVILSNGERRRTLALGESLGVTALPLVGKPFRFAFRRGLKHLGTAPGATAMIGDQLFTDILGANLAGVFSILVDPLTAGGLPHTRWARRLEQRILARHRQAERGSRGRSLYR